LPIQEEIDNRTIALSVKASKLTARLLAKVLAAALRKLKQQRQKAKMPKGRQSVKKLMGQRTATSSIPLDGDTRLFDRVARKYGVDYSFHKTEPGKYMLFFKSGQADAITAAFSEYTKRIIARVKDRNIPLREQMEQSAQRVREKPRDRERSREVSHEER
jgi:hypothetical protein